MSVTTEDREAARRHALRETRAEALAARGRTLRRVEATRPYLVCACGAERYGLPLAQVAQVLPARPCTALPGAPPALLGLVAVAGRVVSLFGLARALGRPGSPDPETGHIVLVRGAAAVALLVDRVDGVHAVPEDALGAAAGPELGLGDEAVSGYVARGPGPGSGTDAETGLVLVDLPRLVRRYVP